MFFNQYQWQVATPSQRKRFLKIVRPVEPGRGASAASTQVEWAKLPFYKTFVLVRIDDADWPPGTGPLWSLSNKQGWMFHLNGKSAPIHAVNEADRVHVNESNVLDYLRFFSYFVHGSEGPFFIVEGIDHPVLDVEKMGDPPTKDEQGNWDALNPRIFSDKELNIPMKDVVAGVIRPAVCDGKTDDGAMTVSASVVYDGALHSARFSVTENGACVMIDDEPIAAIPVQKSKPNDQAAVLLLEIHRNTHIAWLICLYRVLQKARKEGLIAIESDVEEPQASLLFQRFPQVHAGPYLEFATDVLRLMVGGNLNAHEMITYADHYIAGLTAPRRRTGLWHKPDASLLRAIWQMIWACMCGYNPATAVEFGRQAIPVRFKPGFLELETLCRSR